MYSKYIRTDLDPTPLKKTQMLFSQKYFKSHNGRGDAGGEDKDLGTYGLVDYDVQCNFFSCCFSWMS